MASAVKNKEERNVSPNKRRAVVAAQQRVFLFFIFYQRELEPPAVVVHLLVLGAGAVADRSRRRGPLAARGTGDVKQVLGGYLMPIRPPRRRPEPHP